MVSSLSVSSFPDQRGTKSWEQKLIFRCMPGKSVVLRDNVECPIIGHPSLGNLAKKNIVKT